MPLQPALGSAIQMLLSTLLFCFPKPAVLPSKPDESSFRLAVAATAHVLGQVGPRSRVIGHRGSCAAGDSQGSNSQCLRSKWREDRDCTNIDSLWKTSNGVGMTVKSELFNSVAVLLTLKRFSKAGPLRLNFPFGQFIRTSHPEQFGSCGDSSEKQLHPPQGI